MKIILLNEKIRKILFATLHILLFATLSLNNIIKEDYNGLKITGILITIWSTFNISYYKNKYYEVLSNWEQAITKQRINYYAIRDEYRDKSIELTFNLHALQIAQISNYIGVPNPFTGLNNHKDIEELGKVIEDRFKEEDKFKKDQEKIIREYHDVEQSYSVVFKNIGSWPGFMMRLEVFMMIWGSLQGAFGKEIILLLYASNKAVAENTNEILRLLSNF